MLNVKFILLCVIVIVNYIYANPVNPVNPTPQCVGLYERWDDCGPACPQTCDNFQENIICTDNCVPSCVCTDGAVRNRWGNCVPEKKCALENRARALNPDHSRVLRFHSKREAPKSENFWKSDLKKAKKLYKIKVVKMNYSQYLSILSLILLNIHLKPILGTLCAEGPNSSPTCQPQTEADCTERETLNSCGNLCERSCDDIEGKRPCPLICGPPACVCSGNYVRHPNGQCVLPQECPIQQCPPHEYLKLCGRICEDTCENNGKPKLCPRIQCSNFTQNCSCSEGYVRNSKDICVLPEECPQCQQNQTYTDCGSSCPRTCNPRSDAQISCLAVCLTGCFCSPGYVTSQTYGGCILPDDCPNSEKCFDNEEYQECGTACPDTCDNYRNPNRPCTKQCVQGCFCKPGLVLNSDGKCISPDQCPPPTCGEHEVYTDCGTACPDTCSNLGTKLNCIALCVPGCFCEQGYVRSASGKCVLPSQCPVNETCTKPNERYNECGTKNQRSCTNFFNYSPPAGGCEKVCECDNGYVRDCNGFCTQPQSCPNLCGKNEKFDCGSACDTECATLGQPCPIQNIKCNEKCYCIDGYARNSKGECIPINECPKKECTCPQPTRTRKRRRSCNHN
ncbi:zonadhesin-like [Chrysoperla carnea]|uniref:zonadhesin-like n=1 Tax=Chrysoperla carnea TaxID=189513 RepID=UPI001D06C0DB|nr:zonadhesin-like [Chrysoperla carnea]